MDKTGPQLQSAGNKRQLMSVFVKCMSALFIHYCVLPNSTPCVSRGRKKRDKTLVTTDSRISVVVLSTLAVCSESYTAWKTRKVTTCSLLVVFINIVLQMQPNTAVHNPRSVLAPECALFLVKLLFVRHCTAWKTNKNADSCSPFFCSPLTGVWFIPRGC